MREDSFSPGLHVEELPERKGTDEHAPLLCYVCRILHDVVQNGLGQPGAVRAAVEERSKDGDCFGGDSVE